MLVLACCTPWVTELDIIRDNNHNPLYVSVLNLLSIKTNSHGFNFPKVTVGLLREPPGHSHADRLCLLIEQVRVIICLFLIQYTSFFFLNTIGDKEDRMQGNSLHPYSISWSCEWHTNFLSPSTQSLWEETMLAVMLSAAGCWKSLP